MRILITVIVFVTFIHAYSALNILVVIAWPGKSHFWLFSKLFRNLAERGHNITLISHNSDTHHLPNYRNVEIGNIELAVEELGPFCMFENIRTDRVSMYLTQKAVTTAAYTACEVTLQSESVQAFMKEENSFDLILLEDFYSECLWPIAQKYGSPVIRMLSHVPTPWTGKRIANPLGPAYLPNMHLPLTYSGLLFFERVENCVLTVINLFYFEYVLVSEQKKMAGKYLTVDERTFDNRFLNTSLVLMNTHFSLNYPKPLVPNIVEVGGLHIGEAQLLPQDIEKWINESTHGVIYFSLGSVIKGHTMLEEKRKAFINAFKRLPQRVIWKWENDTMEGKTDNILIGKWMPQFDILSHPNVKAFISHGGLLGTMEAVHCGVPMMVMPQFGDQHTNAKALESVGGGVVLYMDDANEDLIYESLKKILEPSFQSQTKELSRRFRDRPMPPLETAIYWVEYVARHKGAHFMKTAAVNMPFYQYYLLDVIAFIVLVLTVFLYVIFVSLRSVLRIFGFFPKKIHKVKKS